MVLVDSMDACDYVFTLRAVNFTDNNDMNVGDTFENEIYKPDDSSLHVYRKEKDKTSGP